MHQRTKKSLAALTVATSVAGGAAAGLIFAPGLSLAQDDQTETPTPEAADSTTPDESPDIAAKIRERLQNLVDDATITAAQADAVAADLAADLPDRGMGGGHGGPGGFGRGMGFDTLSDVLGLDASEIMTALRDGQTIAELAEAQGVTTQAVVDALVAEASDHLAEEVTEGDLTQAEADTRLADITERITDFVENGGDFGGDGGFGPGFGPGRGHGPFGD